MEAAAKDLKAEQMTAVALKAFGNVMSEWGVPLNEAAALADMSESTWKRARKPGFSGGLTKDQMLRLSAVIGIYKALKLYFSDPIAVRWMTLPNNGPLFGGARPVDTLIEEGLPQFLRVRNYLDALRGGA
ncbi:MbcA/ParS/Xre antitoxin family protein [Neorhizobium sp. CSC1952]|uniref:MbcA/ParS/Xre antitoxin family protein n=1 Tax=Neorhizobium sp. CSC1952 TaxID=2978974 RepID=UPI0025A5664A|nr:MbcA/ParS/Xre antitoxin family protein [Rhizobium sp. CSC1952]WJR67525.1 MbcA/ParS/Xre antitoxin family protein [Rhizobium sp. CSC1952]